MMSRVRRVLSLRGALALTLCMVMVLSAGTAFAGDADGVQGHKYNFHNEYGDGAGGNNGFVEEDNSLDPTRDGTSKEPTFARDRFVVSAIWSTRPLFFRLVWFIGR